jgi:uncharacterized repeat protein (TIGR01451 family)
VLGFSTNNTTLTRVFDKNEAPIGDLITVTVTYTNSETSSLRGFYYADQVPQGLTLSTTSVKINGSSVSNYTHEAGSPGDVYAGNIVHRWILETPTSFSENNPVTSGSNVQIVEELVDLVMVTRLYEANMEFLSTGRQTSNPCKGGGPNR